MQNRMMHISQINFTDSAYSVLYDVVDDPRFMEADADLIYQALRRRLRAVPFGDYLKRYIYKAAEMTEPFQTVPLETYRRIMADSFRETMTPVSFQPTAAKSGTMYKNWLTQKSVRREVALLLGFGLRMTEEEVNEMLYKALRERALDPTDPEELICWYCYRNHCVFPKFVQLKQRYLEGIASSSLPDDLQGEERDLIEYLLAARTDPEKTRSDEKTRQVFEDLFARAQTMAARLLSTAEKGGRSPSDLTEADLEKILCSAIPRNDHGNFTPAKKSLLCDLFAGKLPSRQRFGRVRTGRDKPDRFDLITLSFLTASQREGDRKKRYLAFLDETNALLDACGFGPVYAANPYECFILMCILSEEPLATYCDVWELSYTPNDAE